MAHTVQLTACHKGGTGKSTTTVAMAYCTAVMTGKKVLIVDLDPQGDATVACGVMGATGGATAGVLTRGEDAESSAVRLSDHVSWDPMPVPPEMYLLPGGDELSDAKVKLAGSVEDIFFLSDTLDKLDDDWIVFIDTAPDQSTLTTSAVLAATDLVVPSKPEFADYRGALDMWPRLRQLAGRHNPELNWAGLLVNNVDGRDRSKAKSELIQAARQVNVEGGTFDTMVRRDVRVMESYGYGMPPGAYEPDSMGVRDQRDLTLEFLTVRSDAARKGEQVEILADRLPQLPEDEGETGSEGEQR
jgi:chromosome partitioning protein